VLSYRIPRLLRTAIFAFLLLAPVVAPRTAAFLNASAGEYIAQDYVDTLIQRALYGLTDASQKQIHGDEMENAVSAAKEISHKLKKQAEKDPNKKYILWRCNELDEQIYLEERGLAEKNARKKQVAANQKIADFNAEQGKRRPEFGMLFSAAQAVIDADPKRGAEVESAYKDRCRGIANELVPTIENALDDKNFTRAREELAYCKDNMKYLGISVTAYSRLAARLQSNVTIDQELAFLDSSMNRVEKSLSLLDIANARSLVDVNSERLAGIREITLQKIWDRYYFRNKRLIGAVDKKEDSLVQANLVVLKKSGVMEANDFLTTVLKKHGVSHEKIMMVDNTIVNTAVQQGAADEQEQPSMLAAVEDTSSSSISIFDNLRAKARTRSQEKQDSVRATTVAMGRVTQVEEVRRANLQTTADERRQREDQRTQGNAQQAQKYLVEIYTLVERKKARDALKKFGENKDFLKTWLTADVWKSLDSTMLHVK